MAKEEAIMYNLVGHELANVIVQCDGLAGNLQAMREDNEREDFLHEYYQKTVEATAKRFKHVGATADGIKREVESMMLDPMTDWGKSSLPVPAHLWKFSAQIAQKWLTGLTRTGNRCCDSACLLENDLEMNRDYPCKHCVNVQTIADMMPDNKYTT